MKLLIKIFSNIINNPTKIDKYGNLKAISVIQKLDGCQPAVTLLVFSGFALSDDQTQLIWVNTDENMIRIQYIHMTLTSLANPISTTNINDNDQDIDLIYTNRDLVKCFGKDATESEVVVKDCECLSRMLNAIKYVKSLRENIDDESTQILAFEIYFNEEYLQCLNDYIHITSMHSNHLEQLNKELGECVLSQCKMANRCNHNDRRRYRNDDNKIDHENVNENYKIKFHTDLLDRLHFWLYHQFDVGMRISRSIIHQNEDADDFIDDEDTKNKYYDHAFARMRREIARKRNKWRMNHSIPNQNDIQCSKYTMPVESGEFKIDFAQNETTYIDSIFEELENLKIPTDTMTTFRNFLMEEQYDTDTIIADIIDHDRGSNILLIIKQQQIRHFIQSLSEDLNGVFAHLFTF